MCLNKSHYLSCALTFFILAVVEQYAIDYDFSQLGDSPEEIETKDVGEKTLSAAEVFSYFQQLATVSAATKVSQTVFEVPASNVYLDDRDFNTYGFLTLNEAIWQQAGFFFAQGGERRTIGMRGYFEDWNNTHYLHLVDGIPFNDNADGSAHTWEATPVIFIKNFEIVRGPGSPLYGSNATNGVLSVTTFSGNDLRGQTDIRMRYGSLNTARFEFLTGDAKTNYQYVVAYQRHTTSGNDQIIFDEFLKSGRIDSEGNPIPVKVRDEKSANYLFLKVQGQRDLQNLMFQYHRQWYQFGTYEGWANVVPDEAEEMQQNRDIFALSYQTPAGRTFRQEILTRLQIYHQNYHLRLIPDYGSGGLYPDGASEVLDTTTYDLFLRYQMGFQLPYRMDFLIGSENTIFYYFGDRVHFANFDPNHPDYLPFLASKGHPEVSAGDENTTRPLPPFLEPINERPIYRNSLYAQWLSGELFGQHLQISIGARFDRFSTTYYNVNDDEEKSLVFQNLSPRLGLVILPAKNLSFKLLAAQAFRDPALIELFASNSWVAASNPETLKPEILRSTEFVTIWEFYPMWLLQSSFYYINFTNLISYDSAGTNILQNLYSMQNAGADLEVRHKGKFFSFAFGYSYVTMLSFTPISETISEISELSDAPQHSGRISLAYDSRYFLFALTYAYQHQVRLSSPLAENSPYYGFGYKPEILPSFHHLNLRGVYHASKNLDAGMEIRNALNQKQYTINTVEAPYLYRRELLQILIYLRLLL